MDKALKSVTRLFVFGVGMAAYEAINSAIRTYGKNSGNDFIVGISKILSVFGAGLNAFKYSACM